jgi:hypothetical protein
VAEKQGERLDVRGLMFEARRGGTAVSALPNRQRRPHLLMQCRGTRRGGRNLYAVMLQRKRWRSRWIGAMPGRMEMTRARPGWRSPGQAGSPPLDAGHPPLSLRSAHEPISHQTKCLTSPSRTHRNIAQHLSNLQSLPEPPLQCRHPSNAP